MERSLALKSTWQNALAVRNLSLRALAREIGISHTYLAEIIAGNTLPSASVRLRLLAYFNEFRPEDLFDLAIPADQAAAIPCKRCHSNRTIKSGVFHGSQRYQCKDCGCVFINNNAPLQGGLPVEAVVAVMEYFFAGEPLDSIRTLVEESQSILFSVSGLEKVVYRYARKAIQLAGDILPSVQSRWFLDGVLIPGVEPVFIVDILDLATGVIISSGILRDSLAKEFESVLKMALHITDSTPSILILSESLSSEFLDDESPAIANKVDFTPAEEAVCQRYLDSRDARTQTVRRRLNYDTTANTRLIVEAWRVHYNFLSGLMLAGDSIYNRWLDIVNAPVYPEGIVLLERGSVTSGRFLDQGEK